MKIKPGDVVTLKCDRFKMVVNTKNDLHNNLECVWHTATGSLCRSEFKENSLELVEPEECSTILIDCATGDDFE